MPDSLLLEQLYSQLDLLGQIQAMRSLSLDRKGVGGSSSVSDKHRSEGICDCGGETLPEQRLRLRGLVDILVNAQNDMQVNHSLLARCEAAYAMAQWQILHAPSVDSTCILEGVRVAEDKGDEGGQGAWIGMNLLIACTRNMFMEPMCTTKVTAANAPTAASSTSDQQTNVKKVSLIPLPNDLANHEKTHLRDALLQALAGIRAKNGQTPVKVVELLLCFAENNDNVSAGPRSNGGSSAGKKGETECYNDGQYCALLMLALSQVQLAVVGHPGIPVGSAEQRQWRQKQKHIIISLLKRIIAVCTYFLHGEQIMLACLADDGTAEHATLEPPEVHTSFVKQPSGRLGRQSSSSASRDFRRGLLERNEYERKASERGMGGCDAEEHEDTTSDRVGGRGVNTSGGMVVSVALQCICHAQIQLSRVMSNNPDGPNDTPTINGERDRRQKREADECESHRVSKDNILTVRYTLSFQYFT